MEWVKTEWVVPRMGFYFLPEAEGENEVPERPLDGRKVAKYWREMHEERGARKKRRQAAFPGPEAPAHRHASAQKWRYTQKIEVKVLESIMDLFHRLLAPGGEGLRGGLCARKAGNAAGGPQEVPRLARRAAGHPPGEAPLDALGAASGGLPRRAGRNPKVAEGAGRAPGGSLGLGPGPL